MSNRGQVKPLRICFVVAVPFTANAFLSAHILALARKYSVSIALNGTAQDLRPELRQTPIHRFCIVRKIAPFHDFIALISLWILFRREHFDLTHSMTPKAGLLASVAGYLAGVPLRIHWFTGQVWATKKGLFLLLLKNIDRLTTRLATHILVDSPSQLRFLRSERVLPRGKGNVLGIGSVSGVDLKRFRPNPSVRKKIRKRMGLAKNTVAFLFVGRLNRDKGIPELYEAFQTVRNKIPNAQLILVGPKEENIPLPAGQMGFDTGVVHVGPSSRPEDFMAAADVFVLPSHREGFGSTVIEANACGIPVVASRIYGLMDAVVHGKTGLLVTCGDAGELSQAMEKLGKDRKLRVRMGRAAQRRVKARFDQKEISGTLLQFYRKIASIQKAETRKSAPADREGSGQTGSKSTHASDCSENRAATSWERGLGR